MPDRWVRLKEDDAQKIEFLETGIHPTRKEFNPILLALDTTSPSVSVSTGMSHVDLFSIKNIERNKHSFMLISKNGDIINLRPDTGVITFNGDVKGSIWSCKIER